MSIWTSSAGGLFAALLILTGCAAPTGGGSRAVTVSGVTVAGPPGYCVDRSASRDGSGGGFVLLGSCAALAGGGAPAAPVLLTASVLPPRGQELASASPLAAMDRFVRSTPGRAALSRSGRAGSVRIAQTSVAGDVLYIRLTDSSESQSLPVAPDYWRAVFATGGRIVSLSAMEVAGHPVDSAEKRRALAAFVARVKAVNAIPAGGA